MKGILISIAILILGLGVSGQAVERKYDRFKDETSISIILGKTQMDVNYNSLTSTLSSTFAGQKVPSDPPIIWSILISSKEWRLLRADLTMRAIIDGERLTVGEFKRNFSDVYRGAVMEGAIMSVTVETLRKLVAGKKVELPFMGTEAQPTKVELDRIQAFLRSLEQ